MAADDFFRRWSKPKFVVLEAQPPAQRPQAPAAEPEPRVATAADLAALRSDSDFAPFMAQGVDEALKRAALKKLFSDPRFNRMDGLDTYIEDYNKFESLPSEMLAALNHAKSLLNPPAGTGIVEPRAEEEGVETARSVAALPLDQRDMPITESPAQQEPLPANRAIDAE